ncbi:MAG: AraC family transcriptional regulator [Clostridia bacterium]
MTKRESVNIEVLPKGVLNPAFEQREAGRSHSPYEVEKKIYECVKDGDIEKLNSIMLHYASSPLVVGRLSDNSLRQMQYLAVSCVTLGIRYAMEGGLDESEAYNLSDKYIQMIDKIENPDEIMPFIAEKSIEITALVHSVKQRTTYPKPVKICLKYIDKNLHNKITLDNLAEACGLSNDYLSALFKKHTGVSISKYILRQKLEASKALLNGDCNYSEIGYYFSFCSETYYISCFKREFGVTPREYAQKNS